MPFRGDRPHEGTHEGPHEGPHGACQRKPAFKRRFDLLPNGTGAEIQPGFAVRQPALMRDM